MSRLPELFAELRRRRVWRVAALYAGGAFVAVEAADLFFPNLGLPGWTVRLAALLAVAGFPVAVVLAWAFDLTPEGLRPARGDPGGPWASRRSRLVALLGLGGVTVFLGMLGWWGYVRTVGPPEIHRLAVLPLTNLMDDPVQDYFVQGMHDRLISELQQAGVPVIARTSVMPYADGGTPVRQIAQELGVEAVIEGSVFRAADRLTIEARLVDGVTEEYLWQDSFDGDLGDVGALHRDLTRAIAGEIHRALEPEAEARLAASRTVDPRAYEAHLRGIFHLQRFTDEDVVTAEGYFERALEVDSTYAPAWVGLARVWTRSAEAPGDAGGRWESALERALELDPDLAEAHLMFATQRAWRDWDWEGAEESFRRAVALNPGLAEARVFYGHLLTILGRWEEASDEMEAGLALDPLNPFIHGMYATHLVMVRRHHEAIERLRTTLRTNPGAGFGRGVLAATLRDTGRWEEAHEVWREEYHSRGRDDVVAALDLGYEEDGYRGAYRHAAETLAAASRSGSSGPIVIAGHYLTAGDSGRALEWLETAVEERDTNAPYLGTMPTFVPLHEHPRFRELARRVGVPLLDGPRARPAG